MQTIPEYRMTGNILNRYPILSNYKRLPKNHRLNYTTTPIERTWIFVKPSGKVINFYPIFLHITSKKTNINYQSISWKLSLSQAANINYNKFKNI